MPAAAPQDYTLLAAALRRVLDAASDTRRLDASTVAAATGALDRITDDLVAALDRLPDPPNRVEFDGQRAQMPEWDFEHRDDALVARGTFTAAHAGHPGTVHGGYVAFAFDEILGWANTEAGYTGMTGKLTVRYRRPTPTGVPVEVRVPWPRVVGKRVHAHGTLSVDGRVTAEADALFVHFTGRPDAAPYATGERSGTQEG